MGSVGIDHLARLRGFRFAIRLGVRHVDKAVALSRVAERERWREAVEIVRPERQHVGKRYRVVEIDECVHARERPAREHVLQEPLDRGAIARLLDAEALVGRAPCRDAGDLRELRAAPALARGRLALRDQGIERCRTLGCDRQPFGDHECDTIIGKRACDIGDGNLHRFCLVCLVGCGLPFAPQKINIGRT